MSYSSAFQFSPHLMSISLLYRFVLPLAFRLRAPGHLFFVYTHVLDDLFQLKVLNVSYIINTSKFIYSVLLSQTLDCYIY